MQFTGKGIRLTYHYSAGGSDTMNISYGFHLFRNGDTWCAVGPDFVDIQRSPAGFRETQEGAVNALHAELRKRGWHDSALPVLGCFKVHDDA
jgi:hypothetical protein